MAVDGSQAQEQDKRETGRALVHTEAQREEKLKAQLWGHWEGMQTGSEQRVQHSDSIEQVLTRQHPNLACEL